MGILKTFLVSIDIIEALSGVNFFAAPDDGIADGLEKIDTWKNWGSFAGLE